MSESPSIDAAVAAAIQHGEVPVAEVATAVEAAPSEPDAAQDTEDGLD